MRKLILQIWTQNYLKLQTCLSYQKEIVIKTLLKLRFYSTFSKSDIAMVTLPTSFIFWPRSKRD